ncbi:helix-turn-helix transcriptional regulator [Pelagibacterium sp.]|uniref:helix-turn-helix transcriptional regulator n=1 Tax=Pelagibacterium sp. TaxID=1967288 RepID=UPI003A8E5225
MNVRTLCLSILYTQDASGYEIRKLCTEGNGAYFAEASFGSIYPALSKLEDEGLLTSTIQHQNGKPSKKIYSITEAGRAAFCDALHEPLGEDVYRSPFLLFARFAHLLDQDLVKSRIQDRLAELEAEIAELRALEHKINIGNVESHANDAWVLSHGIACLEVAHQHLHTHMNSLIASARRDQLRVRQQAAE